MSVPNMELFQIKIFVLLSIIVKFIECNYIKLFEIKGLGCYNVNVIFISSQNNGLLKYVKFGFRQASSSSCI